MEDQQRSLKVDAESTAQMQSSGQPLTHNWTASQTARKWIRGSHGAAAEQDPQLPHVPEQALTIAILMLAACADCVCKYVSIHFTAPSL